MTTPDHIKDIDGLRASHKTVLKSSNGFYVKVCSQGQHVYIQIVRDICQATVFYDRWVRDDVKRALNQMRINSFEHIPVTVEIRITAV